MGSDERTQDMWECETLRIVSILGKIFFKMEVFSGLWKLTVCVICDRRVHFI